MLPPTGHWVPSPPLRGEKKEKNIEVVCKFESESEISVGIHECLLLIDFPPFMDTAKLRDTEQPVEISNQFLEVGSMKTSFDQEITKQV